MVKTSDNSKIEIWKGDYINNTDNQRFPEDAIDKVDIVQIEPGSLEGDYMVEVVKKGAKDDDKRRDAIFNSGKLTGLNIMVTRLQNECGNPNRDWYSSKIYDEIRDYIVAVRDEFKREIESKMAEEQED